MLFIHTNYVNYSLYIVHLSVFNFVQKKTKNAHTFKSHASLITFLLNEAPTSVTPLIMFCT